MDRVFLLSPAFAGGKRAQMIFNPQAGFSLAKDLQRGVRRPLGEVFSFLSGLYFRGKLAYAKAFARSARGCCGAWVITPNQGLMDVDTLVGLEELRAFSTVPIDESDERYTAPLKRDLARLAASPLSTYVLLGSVSTGKYVNVLLDVLGERLMFPKEFVGRGDMSRGGLMLRAVRDGQELEYAPVRGAIRRGVRPPKLEPVNWTETALGVQQPGAGAKRKRARE